MGLSQLFCSLKGHTGLVCKAWGTNFRDSLEEPALEENLQVLSHRGWFLQGTGYKVTRRGCLVSLWILMELMAIYNACSNVGHQSAGNEGICLLSELLVIPNNNPFYQGSSVHFWQFASHKLSYYVLTFQFLIWCLFFFFPICMSLHTDRACTRLN